MSAPHQTYSESQQNDREYQQRDGAQAIIALPKVEREWIRASPNPKAMTADANLLP
jgi:hypothetical protein